MRNDELITDLVLSKNLTSFQEMTGLCDYHKLIVNNHALILFKCHMRYGILHRTTKKSGVFLSLVQTNFFCNNNSKKNDKVLACQRNFVVSVLPKSSRVTN